MEQTIAELFEARVRCAPDAPALRCSGQTMTYGQLNAAAHQRAAFLHARGIGAGQFVGIVEDHGFDQIIDILAVMKAGAAYVPMEPTFPRGRIGSIIEQTGMACVFTRRIFAGLFDEAVADILVFDDAPFSDAPSVDHPIRNTAEDVAYVLFTSGTTGVPKGVVVLQRNLCHYVRAFQYEFHPTAADRMLQNSVCTFDIFVEEVFPILLSGGVLVIATDADKMDARHLEDLMCAEGVTMLSGFPYLLASLDATRLPRSLRLAISGGDSLRPQHVAHLLGRMDVYNTYGPTETTVCATYYRCPSSLPADKPVPVGRAVMGARVFLLDEHLHPVDAGKPGEICIAGDGVSRGYLRNDVETADRFVEDPWGSGKLYRSGDLGVLRPDGQLVFLKRKDAQVMIEGRRVEPRGVENVMYRFPGMQHAVVATYWDTEGYPYLVGYYCADAPTPPAQLRMFMADSLPEFMIPETLVHMERMPLTQSGKIDRRALPPVAKVGAAYRPGDTVRDFATKPPLAAAVASARVGFVDVDTLEYRKAGIDDIDELTETRLEVMYEVWDLAADANLETCAQQTRTYYEQAIPTGEHTALLVHDGDSFVACGGISYFRVMPTWDNPTGRKAYVMNMYTRPAYRHRGIARRMLSMLVDDARARGVDFIALEASDAGRPLYEREGFVSMPDEMLLRIDVADKQTPKAGDCAYTSK